MHSAISKKKKTVTPAPADVRVFPAFLVSATSASAAFFASASDVYTSWPDDVEGEGWLAEEVEWVVDRREECIGNGQLTSIFAAFIFTEIKDIKIPKLKNWQCSDARKVCPRAVAFSDSTKEL